MTESWWKRLRIRARHRRYVVRSNPPRWHRIYRIAVAVVGTVVLLCGLVTIPYRVPAGSSSSSDWESCVGIRLAHRLLKFARAKYDAWMEWIGRQHWSVQSVFWIGTCAIVVGTLWLLGGALQTAAGWANLHYEWLASPIFS